MLNRRDEGMTLTELLVVVLVLGLILVPLGNAFVSFLRVSDESNDRMAESQDAQLATFYFDHDVHAVGVRDWSVYPYALLQSVELNVAPTGGLYPCGNAGDPAAIIRLAWDNPTSASGDPDVVRVAYWLTTTGDGQELHRVVCVGSATPVSDTTVANNVESVAAPVCSPTCTAAPPPATISMDLVLRAPGSKVAPFTVTLQGQRRQT